MTKYIYKLLFQGLITYVKEMVIGKLFQKIKLLNSILL